MASRRTRRPREPQPIHPTRAVITSAAADILKSVGVAKFHVDDVLSATGLTRGALYHHFENVDDLVESALLATYAEGVSVNIGLVQKVLATATTFDEFRAGVLGANVVYAQNEALRAVRSLRAHALAATAGAERMAAALAGEQQRLTDTYVEVITAAQTRGWVRASIEPESLAVFIQAYSFGVIIDDVSEQHISPDAWEQFIAEFFERTVFAEQD